MSLTGTALLIILGAATLIVPLILTVLWSRPIGRSGLRGVVARISGLLTCQLLAVATLFVWVNDQYVFYSSWADLFGTTSQTARIETAGLVSRGNGRVATISVPDPAVPNNQVLVWFPPQYDHPQFQQTRFPVIMVLSGQPSQPQTMFRNFNFGSVAAGEIAAGRMKPFVAVFPPLMTNPPRDTECTDVPGGPQAQRWLATSVPGAVAAQTRTLPTGRNWSLLGWSTGAFCASKLLISQPAEFAAAASLGGYYRPIIDRTTGDLFRGNATLRNQNSPEWLYRHRGLRGALLLVSGRQDRQTWPQTSRLQRLTRADPHVSLLTFPTGGHNYRNYRSYLPAVLDWLGARTASA